MTTTETPIKWQQVIPASRFESFDVFGLYVRVYKDKNATKANFSLGTELCKKLNINVGDKIGVFYDPDHPTHIMLAKATTGYKAAATVKERYLTICARLPNLDRTKVEMSKTKKVTTNIDSRAKTIDFVIS